MKIHIHHPSESCIEGFRPIPYTNFELINNVIDNSCEYIISNNIFDNFPHNSFNQVMSMILKKLRKNGSWVITGSDINILSKKICNNTMTISEMSEIINEKKSINNVLNIIDELEKNNLKIITTKLVGHNYEIMCQR